MTPWPKDLLKEWDELTADEKKMFIRQVEVYAAYLAYTDHEIGRVIQAVEDMGKLDNTLIIYISGDNGSSAEGQLIGTPNEVAMFNGVEVPVEDQLKYFYDAWGTRPDLQPHGGAAGPGPSTRRSRGPSRSRRTSAAPGRACAFPGRATSRTLGGIRNQFHHVIDVVPTILEVCRHPRSPRWSTASSRSPIEGVSMAYTFDKANADAPSHAQDAVFRDDGRPRHLSRRLDRQHEGHPAAVGRGRAGQPGSRQQLHLGALRPDARTGRSSTTWPPRTRRSSRSCRSVLGRRRASTRCCRWTPRWRRGSSRRGPTSRRAAPCSPTPGR